MPEMDYTHLTQDERYQIYILKKAGHNQNAIASLMNRDKSAISRELARNKGRRGYRQKQAQEFAVARKQATVNGRHIAPETWAFAQAKLALQWSPEQIAGYLKTHGEPTVSHETLYRRIYADQLYLDPTKVDAAFYAGMKMHYTEAQIMELGAFIAFHYGMQVFMRTLQAFPLRGPGGAPVSQEEAKLIYGPRVGR